MAEPGTATTYNPETNSYQTHEEWRQWRASKTRAQSSADLAVTQAIASMNKRTAKYSHDTINSLVKHAGKRFREEREKLTASFESRQAELDARFVQMRRDFLDNVRSTAVQMARHEVDGRIQSAIDVALNDHRQERIALVRRVDELADEIERLKQERS